MITLSESKTQNRVGLCSRCPAVSLEPVQLLQHGPGCRAVLVRQVEEVGQQPQVIQGQGLRCVQRVLLESGDIGAASRVVGPLLLETSWRTTRARRDEKRDNTLLGGGVSVKTAGGSTFGALPPGRSVLRNSCSQSVRARDRALWGL